MPSPNAHGVYVHVPWCRVRCPYCAFYVVPEGESEPFAAFVDRVLAEREAWREAFPDPGVSVFLGGGTPSRLPMPELRRLIAGLDVAPGAEIGLEANPEDVEPAWLDAALEAGVTRVSVGVQSLQEGPARRLGRGHTLEQARRAVSLLARSPLRSWSMDLIFAVPGQDLEALDRDLDAVLDSGAPHVSLYGLTFEPDTPFERLRQRGRMRPVSDELWRRMYDRVVERLGQGGLHRYEVSNFARRGHRSVHNSGYWEGRPYLGLGPSAHGFAWDGRRWVNARDLSRWLAGEAPEIEHPTDEEAAADLLLAGMRRVEGVDLRALAERTGHTVDEREQGLLARQGLLQVHDRQLALTHDGFPVADHVCLRLIEGLRPARPHELEAPVPPPPRAGPASDAG